MSKIAYQLGCQTALEKLGYDGRPGDIVLTGPHAVSKEEALRRMMAMSNRPRPKPRPEDLARLARMPGVSAININDLLRKQGSFRVPVTDEQTPQAQTWKATDAAQQARTVDSMWDQHDKRQQLFTSPPWPD